MKQLLFILILCPFIVFGQSTGTRFVGANGGFVVDDAQVAYTNNTTTDQVLFRDTIPAGRLTPNREDIFTAKFYLTVPTLSIPSITFKVTVAGQTMTFVSSAGMISGANNTPITINGVIVRIPNSAATYVEFSIAQPGNAVISLTSANVNEFTNLTIDNTVDVPLAVSVAFGGFTTGTTVLSKKRLKRSDL